jgi:hypothetical protein
MMDFLDLWQQLEQQDLLERVQLDALDALDRLQELGLGVHKDLQVKLDLLEILEILETQVQLEIVDLEEI